MIKIFDKDRKKKQPNIAHEAAIIEKAANELDYSSIGNMLCGKALSDEDKNNVDEFNRQHDRINELT